MNHHGAQWILRLLLPALAFTHLLCAAERHPFLLSPNELAERSQAHALIVIDTRPEADYLKGHIPAAVNIPVDKTFSSSGRKDQVAPLSQIQKLLRGKGINNDSSLVVYDGGSNFHAARVFWVLELYGMPQLWLLDGGYQAWLEEGMTTSTDTPEPKPGQFIPSIKPERLATKYSTRLSTINPNVVIIDTRTHQDYTGETKKPESLRGGHIPSAVNITWSSNLANNQETGRFKSLDELADLYTDITPDQKVITYCHKGQHSSMAYFVLRGLGYDAAVYDGSWFEWGNDMNLPILQE